MPPLTTASSIQASPFNQTDPLNPKSVTHRSNNHSLTSGTRWMELVQPKLLLLLFQHLLLLLLQHLLQLLLLVTACLCKAAGRVRPQIVPAAQTAAQRQRSENCEDRRVQFQCIIVSLLRHGVLLHIHAMCRILIASTGTLTSASLQHNHHREPSTANCRR